jgi:cytochrome oxidase Cu insertion factor (SCO1/SenC/PrrC family)
VENRVAREYAEFTGATLIALAAIVAITVAWWALALWPAGALAPEWLLRTRAACFGAHGDGLPDAGGWISLVGEPLGMLGIFAVLWARSFRRDLHWLREHRAWWLAALSSLALASVFVLALGARAARAWAATDTIPIDIGGVPQRVDRAAPSTALVDQRGARVSLGELHGQPVLLTAAYGHCSTVCPTLVSELRAARRSAHRTDLPLVIITLDPWRDTPERLPTLAQHWELGPNDRVLSGDIADVEQALDRLGIVRRRNETTGDIDHATSVMLVDARGRIAWRADGGASRVAEWLRRGE